MGDNSKIEWTDATWNPIIGCSVVSPACTNCYAMQMAARLEKMAESHFEVIGRTAENGPIPNSHYLGTTEPSKAGPVWTGKVALAPEHILTRPLRWRKPRRIFAVSMGDPFHENVHDSWLDRIFAVMALCPQHTFQVLTKRPERMREYLTAPRPWERVSSHIISDELVVGRSFDKSMAMAWAYDKGYLPNVWVGVTVEDQCRADERLSHLLATPAAMHFVSVEPMLGPVDLARVSTNAVSPFDGVEQASLINALNGHQSWHGNVMVNINGGIDWVICGGESGPKARPMHPDWARYLRDQCVAAGVPFFFKQWGEWVSILDRDRQDPDWRADYQVRLSQKAGTCWLNLDGGGGFHGARLNVMQRVGKARAGRLLDGREWNEFPRQMAGREVR
jgi:protein gp37